MAPNAMASDDGRAAAGERIDNEIARVRAGRDHPAQHGDRFGGGMLLFLGLSDDPGLLALGRNRADIAANG